MKVIILAGGSGTRLYPLSTPEKPKQFLKIIDDKPLIVLTIERFLAVCKIEDIVIVTGEKYRAITIECLKEYNLEKANIVCEPCPRNTAPAIALAVRYCKDELKTSDDEQIFVAPSDHIIKPTDEFAALVKKVVSNSKNTSITLLGIIPTRADTEYGYIKASNSISDFKTVESFKEKPIKEVAEQYLKEGNYYWNAGMFGFSVKAFEQELNKNCPTIYNFYNTGYKNMLCAFDTQEKISIDYAIAEKSNNVQVLPMTCFWTDIGSFSAIYKATKKLLSMEKAIEMITKNIAVLVISCDNYSDCWFPFFTLFKKFWPTCNFKIYLGTNTKDFAFDGLDINVIKIGEDKSWTGNVNKMVEQVKENYFITFLDDFFICKDVDESRINQAIDDFFVNELSGLRLLHHPKGTKKISDTLLEIQPKDEYCIATHIELWDKQVYQKYLIDGYSAWEFEILNSRKCNEENNMLGKFASVKKPIFYWKNGVIQRKWVRSSVKFCNKNGIKLVSNRERMSKKEAINESTKSFLKTILPKKLRKILKNWLLKTKFKDSFVDKTPTK